MRSETIILRHHTPGSVNGFLPLITGANSIPPVILIRKTAAWPPQYRYLYFFQRIHDIHPDLIPGPESIIDTPSEMFGKMAVYIATDQGTRSIPDGNADCILCKDA